MELRPGEAAVLIIRRSDKEPYSYFIAVRKAESSFEFGSNDFRLEGGQDTLYEIPDGVEPLDALVEAASKIGVVEL